MSTATTPEQLIAGAEHSIVAARASEPFLEAHPGLPIHLMHAASVDDGPLLEINLYDDIAAVAAWAEKVGSTVRLEKHGIYTVEHRAETTVDGVRVQVTGFEDVDPDPLEHETETD